MTELVLLCPLDCLVRKLCEGWRFSPRDGWLGDYASRYSVLLVREAADA